MDKSRLQDNFDRFMFHLRRKLARHSDFGFVTFSSKEHLPEYRLISMRFAESAARILNEDGAGWAQAVKDESTNSENYYITVEWD